LQIADFKLQISNCRFLNLQFEICNLQFCLVASATAAAPTAAAETASAATTTTAPAAEAASAAAAAFFARAGFIDGQFPSVDFLIVESLDGGLAFFSRAHLDKAEPFRASRVTIDDDLGGLHRPVLLEQILQIAVGHAIRQVSDVQLHGH
jgi:hypothetical protein